jgi:integrase
MEERPKPKRKRLTKDYPGSVFVPRKCSRLYVNWRGVQESTGLPDTPANRKILENLLRDRWRIERGLRPDYIMEERERAELALTWREIIPRFETHIASIDATDKTRKTYMRAIDIIIRDRGSVVTAHSVERAIRQWLATDDVKTMTPSTVNTYLRGLRVFANWCYRERILTDQVNVNQFTRKGEAHNVLIYSDEECATIVEHFRSRDAELALLIEFLLATGFRINEALRLEWSAVEKTTIVVPNKIRRTPEHFPITQAIQRILDSLPRKGQKVFRFPYSNTNRLTKRLKEGITACGIDPRGGWHTFRRTFQDVLYRAGVDMADRQRLMRHRNITTTIQSYSYTDPDRLREILGEVQK